MVSLKKGNISTHLPLICQATLITEKDLTNQLESDMGRLTSEMAL
jgi:hypothetical protein